MPQFLVFFTYAKPRPFPLEMPRDFLFLATDVSEILFAPH